MTHLAEHTLYRRLLTDQPLTDHVARTAVTAAVTAGNWAAVNALLNNPTIEPAVFDPLTDHPEPAARELWFANCRSSEHLLTRIADPSRPLTPSEQLAAATNPDLPEPVAAQWVRDGTTALQKALAANNGLPATLRCDAQLAVAATNPAQFHQQQISYAQPAAAMILLDQHTATTDPAGTFGWSGNPAVHQTVFNMWRRTGRTDHRYAAASLLGGLTIDTAANNWDVLVTALTHPTGNDNSGHGQRNEIGYDKIAAAFTQPGQDGPPTFNPGIAWQLRTIRHATCAATLHTAIQSCLHNSLSAAAGPQHPAPDALYYHDARDLYLTFLLREVLQSRWVTPTMVRTIYQTTGPGRRPFGRTFAGTMTTAALLLTTAVPGPAAVELCCHLNGGGFNAVFWRRFTRTMTEETVAATADAITARLTQLEHTEPGWLTPVLDVPGMLDAVTERVTWDDLHRINSRFSADTQPICQKLIDRIGNNPATWEATFAAGPASTAPIAGLIDAFNSITSEPQNG